MGAVKLTKNDLKIQKDRLRQFERYLPTLRLKKQQLQAVIMKSAAELERAEKRYAETVDGLDDWVAVFAENATFAEDFKIERLVVPDKVVCGRENIAGVFVPVFKELTFRDADYDVDDYPLWVDEALVRLREISACDALLKTLRKQTELLERELRVTTQRVNLFEKIMIPEARENIRKIEIYLGDQQTSAVVRGKIAKKNVRGQRHDREDEIGMRRGAGIAQGRAAALPARSGHAPPRRQARRRPRTDRAFRRALPTLAGAEGVRGQGQAGERAVRRGVRRNVPRRDRRARGKDEQQRAARRAAAGKGTHKGLGDFDPREVRALSGVVELHFFRMDKREYRALLAREDLSFIRLRPVGKQEAVALVGKPDDALSATEFRLPEKSLSELENEERNCARGRRLATKRWRTPPPV